MRPDLTDRRLLAALEDGLPLVARPFAAIARRAGLSEDEAIARLRRLLAAGVAKRFGVIVRHHELGYRANAMAVWDVPDEAVDAVGRKAADFDFVTLSYRRPRRPPEWPYNLFCMVHGRDRETVRAQIARLEADLGLTQRPKAVLFSSRCFKQCGARYGPPPARGAA